MPCHHLNDVTLVPVNRIVHYTVARHNDHGEIMILMQAAHRRLLVPVVHLYVVGFAVAYRKHTKRLATFRIDDQQSVILFDIG